MRRQIIVAVLGTLIVAAPRIAAAQFEGVIRQRAISVNLEALDERGFDLSNLVDVPMERLLALRGELVASGDMTVTESEIYIKGSRLRSVDANDEGPAWGIIDLEQGIMWAVQPDQRMYIEMTRDDLQQIGAYTGGATEDQPDVARVGETKTINGLRSVAYDVTGYEGTTRVWVSNDDRDLAASFQRFVESLQAMSMDDDPDASFMVAEHGFPTLVLETTYDTFEVEEIVAVEPQSLDDALFVPPAGYQKMTMAEMMGGLGVGGAVAGAVEGGGGVNIFGGAQGATSWVEYSIGGPVTLNGREENVAMCFDTSDGFKARTLGDWVIGVEAEGSGSGAFPAEFYVAAPDQYDDELRDDNSRTDDRFYGDGTVAITDKGEDPLGYGLVEVEFNASGLESGGGIVINVQGTLFCAVM